MPAYYKQIDRRTTIKNQKRNAALGWPAMKPARGRPTPVPSSAPAYQTKQPQRKNHAIKNKPPKHTKHPFLPIF